MRFEKKLLLVVLLAGSILLASNGIELGGMKDGVTEAVAAEARVPDGVQKGMSFATWWSGQYSDPGSDLSLERLAETGTEWISLIVTGYQDTPGSLTIDRFSPSTPTDEDLIHVMERAHELGLKVMLKPHLDLRNEMENDWWRGHIGDDFSTDDQWSAWFGAYAEFIEHYAALAMAHGAEQFCAGTELLGTTHREAQWRGVIEGIRQEYDGPLTYAALHGGEEVSITWWDAVDSIGVDAYYQLFFDAEQHPTVEELEAAWVEPKAILANLSATYDRPILLTEIGYRSQHGCACHPWDSWAQSVHDDEEQANAYEAAFRQLAHEEWLGGIYWWTWLADRFVSGPCDDGYAPYQKPAEEVLTGWYQGEEAQKTALLLPDPGQSQGVIGEGIAGGWQNWSWGAALTAEWTDPVYSGDQSLRVDLEPWGALALRHTGFTSGPYEWLEFYVLAESESAPDLQVYLATLDGTNLPTVPAFDCRFITGGMLQAGEWQRVRIPLDELNPDGQTIGRLIIQSRNGENNTTFWIDDLYFVGASPAAYSVFLPSLAR